MTSTTMSSVLKSHMIIASSALTNTPLYSLCVSRRSIRSLRHGVLTVHDDVYRLVLDARGADHACRSADGVHVAVLVTHDQHLRRIADQLAERIGDHAALDRGALFDLLAQTAERTRSCNGS